DLQIKIATYRPSPVLPLHVSRASATPPFSLKQSQTAQTQQRKTRRLRYRCRCASFPRSCKLRSIPGREFRRRHLGICFERAGEHRHVGVTADSVVIKITEEP